MVQKWRVARVARKERPEKGFGFRHDAGLAVGN
jgi:hypothetical protein